MFKPLVLSNLIPWFLRILDILGFPIYLFCNFISIQSNSTFWTAFVLDGSSDLVDNPEYGKLSQCSDQFGHFVPYLIANCCGKHVSIR